MSVSSSDRHHLHQAFLELIGENADTLMDLLPTDPDRLATSDDVTLLRAELHTDMAELRAELHTDMAELRTELHDDMSALRTELTTEMHELRVELKDEFHDATTGQTRTLLFGLIGTVVTMSVVQLASLLTLA